MTTNGSLIKVYARHDETCAHRADRFHKGCGCPLWYEYNLNAKQIKKSAKTRSWEQAAKTARKLEQTLLTGENPVQAPALGKTVEETIAAYLADRTKDLRPTTLRKNVLITTRLQEWCNRKSTLLIKDVTAQSLLEWRNTWSYRPKSFSFKVHWQSVCTFFRWAHRYDYITSDPAAKVTKPVVDRDPQDDTYGSPQTPPFAPEEMDRILAAIDQVTGWDAEKRNRVRTFILLQRWSGLSCQDAACLERARLEEGNRLVLRRTKTGSPVCVKLPPFVAEALRMLANDNAVYFFWDGEITRESCVGNFQNALHRVFAKANVAGGHSHRFRDTFACECLKAGMLLEDVSKLLGHKSIEVTQRHYNPWVTKRQDRLDETLERAWAAMPDYQPTTRVQ